MASAWGDSWGLAWGDSWGEILGEASTGGFFDYDRLRPSRNPKKKVKKCYDLLLKQLREDKDRILNFTIPDEIREQVNTTYRPYINKTGKSNIDGALLGLAVMELRGILEVVSIRIEEEEEELVIMYMM